MALSQQEQDQLYYEEQERLRQEIEDNLKVGREAVENVKNANQTNIKLNSTVEEFGRNDLKVGQQSIDDGQAIQKSYEQRMKALGESLRLQDKNQQEAAQKLTDEQLKQAKANADKQRDQLAEQGRDQQDKQRQQAQEQDQQRQQGLQESQRAQAAPSHQLAPQDPQRTQGQGQSQADGMAPAYARNTGGNTFGADNKINDSWARHENDQARLQEKINDMRTDIALKAAKGEDVSIDQTKLKLNENTYAINHHDQAARSFGQTAAYAKATSIAGKHDDQTLQKANDMRAMHQYQSEQLKEQQEKIQEQLKEQQKAYDEHPEQKKQSSPDQQKQVGQEQEVSALDKARQAQADLQKKTAGQNQSQDQKQPGAAQDGNVRNINDSQGKDVKQGQGKPQGKVDPMDRVRATEERGQRIKAENEENGKKVVADDTKVIAEQKQKAQELEKNPDIVKKKEVDMGKLPPRQF